MEQVWKALSDGTRRRILDYLRISPQTTGALCRHFKNLTRYGVMKHLNILSKAHLIMIKREGKFRWNYINPVPIQQIYERWVKKYEASWSSYLIQLKKYTESKIMEKIKYKVAISISKPLSEVFKAVTDNNILNKYFVKSASSSIKSPGQKIKWEWVDGKSEITITEFTENKSFAFTWPAYKADYDLNAAFEFEEKDGKTIVTITEEGWKGDDEGINSSLANKEGWTDMLLCLKAWITYGIDLRK